MSTNTPNNTPNIAPYQLAVATISLLVLIATSWVNINSRIAVLETKTASNEDKISQIFQFLKENQEEQSALIKAQTDILIKLESKQNRP